MSGASYLALGILSGVIIAVGIIWLADPWQFTDHGQQADDNHHETHHD